MPLTPPDNRTRYIGDGSTVAFKTGFKVQVTVNNTEEDHPVDVYIAPPATSNVLPDERTDYQPTTKYTVTYDEPEEATSIATVTFNSDAVPAVDHIVWLVASVRGQISYEFSNSIPFNIATLNDAFAQVVANMEVLEKRVSDYALRLGLDQPNSAFTEYPLSLPNLQAGDFFRRGTGNDANRIIAQNYNAFVDAVAHQVSIFAAEGEVLLLTVSGVQPSMPTDIALTGWEFNTADLTEISLQIQVYVNGLVRANPIRNSPQGGDNGGWSISGNSPDRYVVRFQAGSISNNDVFFVARNNNRPSGLTFMYEDAQNYTYSDSSLVADRNLRIVNRTNGIHGDSIVLDYDLNRITDTGKNVIKETALPVGAIMYFGLTSAPANWLPLMGHRVIASEYPDLAEIVNSSPFLTFHESNTEIELKNVTDFFRPAGDRGSVVIGETQDAQLATHTHLVGYDKTFRTGGGSGTPKVLTDPPVFSDDDRHGIVNTDTPTTMSLPTNTTTGSENRPKNVGILACMFAGRRVT